ncbi:hypothetical protein [Acetanaerobacterium elongatum]|uniref:Zinc-finger n=1 Tax=Acetanaerobacterium elongatum TaxID=258515 RepID=A0A1G9U2P1_9FIRM|nr:hypothetical protein [Acetanaerobacterium elongatum]SDM53884.1 hypothetical protein SAMN05192585_10148 [Acetanaerobacterium elongatum]
MCDFFNEDGHLTPQALKATAKLEPLDELTRLEISEHLSFCDKCLSDYTLLLTDSTLVSPPQSQVHQIMGRIKHKARTIFFNRYARVAVAACLAITLWGCGAFSFDYINANNQLVSSVASTSASVTVKMDEWKESISKGFSSFFKNIDTAKPQTKGASSSEKE